MRGVYRSSPNSTARCASSSEIFAAYWTNAGEEEQVVAEPLNTKPRYGASTTLPDPLEWQRSTRLQPDAAASRAGGR
jgi:hypothetical protein